MLEKIVQMSVREYENLVRVSRFRQDQVEKEAVKLWKERGVATIQLRMRVNDSLYEGQMLDCSANLWYKDGKFCIDESMRQRLNKFVTEFMQAELDRYYGTPVALIRRYQSLIQQAQHNNVVLRLIACSGWAVATILLLESWL